MTADEKQIRDLKLELQQLDRSIAQKQQRRAVVDRMLAALQEPTATAATEPAKP